MVRILLLFVILLSVCIQNAFAQTTIEKEFFNKNYELVEQLINEKLEQNNVSAEELEFAAKAKQLMFDFQSAIKYYKLLQEQNDQSTIAIDGLGDCYSALEMHQQALEQYNKILPNDTTSMQIWGKYVVQLFELDKFKEASHILYTLHKNNTGNQYVFKKLITSEYQNKKYEAVISLCNSYLQDYPSDLSVYNYKLIALKKSKQYNGVIEVGNQILKIDSTNLIALNQIALVAFHHLKNYEIAVDAYRNLNCLENFSDLGKIKNQAICEYFVGNDEFAAPLLDTLCMVLLEDPFVYFYAGLSNGRLGNADKALEQLEVAASLSIPDYVANVYHHLGRAYAGKRMKDEAIATYLKVREYDATNYHVLYDIASIYDEFSLNKSFCLPYYERFVLEFENSNSNELKYAQQRIKRIKEEMFFAGE